VFDFENGRAEEPKQEARPAWGTPSGTWDNAEKFGVTLVEISALRLWKIIQSSALPQSFGV